MPLLPSSQHHTLTPQSRGGKGQGLQNLGAGGRAEELMGAASPEEKGASLEYTPRIGISGSEALLLTFLILGFSSPSHPQALHSTQVQSVRFQGGSGLCPAVSLEDRLPSAPMLNPEPRTLNPAPAQTPPPTLTPSRVPPASSVLAGT